MAHRQKNRDGTPIRHELTAANDCDTAHREVLQRMETYGKDPDATLEEVSRDTVLLLRALNHRVRHFQAQILADIRIRESNNRGTDADEEEQTPQPSPARQPVKNEETRPITGRPALQTTTNEHYSVGASGNHSRPDDPTHRETRPIPEIDTPVTNLADKDDNGTETKIAITGQYKPQPSKHITSVNNNENGNTADIPEQGIRERDPHEPGAQSAAENTGKTLRSSPSSRNTATNDSTTPHYDQELDYDYSPTKIQAGPPVEGERHVTCPPRRPKDRDTTDPETKFDTRYAHYQRHIIIRPHTAVNRGELHTNRDVNLVPDRGKKTEHRT